MFVLICAAAVLLGMIVGGWMMLAHCRKERGQIRKKLNKIDVILILVGMSTIVFIGVMITLFIIKDAVPDSLIAGYFAAVFGEVSICGWIKNSVEKNKGEKED